MPLRVLTGLWEGARDGSVRKEEDKLDLDLDQSPRKYLDLRNGGDFPNQRNTGS